MSLQACRICGVGFDLDHVPANPFKKCPGCGAPLDQGAVDHTFVEASNPSNPGDAMRQANRAALQTVAALHNPAVPMPDQVVSPDAAVADLRAQLAKVNATLAETLAQVAALSAKPAAPTA